MKKQKPLHQRFIMELFERVPLSGRNMVIILFGILFLAATGCGGGGGGGGRYTLPGEIPSGGGTGGTTGGGGTGGGGSSGGETNPDSLIASAWADFKLQAYSSAVTKFNQVLENPSLTDTQKTEAYNGLGWSLAKSSGLESAATAFTQASTSNNESRIGLAALYMQRAQKGTMAQAVQLLESVGLGDTAFKFQAIHPIGVSNAEAHAMLSFCYFWRNDTDDSNKSKAQIQVARSEDPAGDSSVGQIYTTLKSLNPTWGI